MPSAPMKSPAENTLTPETFRLVATHTAAVASGSTRQMPRQYARLLVGRFDQAITDAAMLGAFAEREDIRRAGLQDIVDDDAAIDGNAGLFRQRGVGPDAGGENHRVGVDPPSVCQFDAFDAGLAMERARCWR